MYPKSKTPKELEKFQSSDGALPQDQEHQVVGGRVQIPQTQFETDLLKGLFI